MKLAEKVLLIVVVGWLAAKLAYPILDAVTGKVFSFASGK